MYIQSLVNLLTLPENLDSFCWHSFCRWRLILADNNLRDSDGEQLAKGIEVMYGWLPVDCICLADPGADPRADHLVISSDQFCSWPAMLCKGHCCIYTYLGPESST